MSRLTLRFVIVLAVISITGITLTQIYWVRKAFDIKKNQFYRDVNVALRNVAEKVQEVNKLPSTVNNPVNQVSTNYFIVLVNGQVDPSILEFLLVTEFEKRNVIDDFEYGIYDCVEKCMVGGNYVSPWRIRTVAAFPETPRLSNDGYYFAVQFPYLEANLLSQMGIWGFSSVVTLIVIFFFGYTLMVILRQRRLSEIQRDFINNMTHEFKTPISTIAISAEVLKTPTIIETPERLLSYATIIQNESHRLKQQVERVLQIAEVDKDIQLRLEIVDLNELIRESCKALAIRVENQNGVIQMELHAVPAAVRADRLHFSNVIYNLLDNALKYSAEKPEITVTTRALNSDQIELSVRDRGIGISVQDQRKIFQRFYRVPTGNLHDVKGFGLGLNYVKTMVEAHSGKISVESYPGIGTTFRIVLPNASKGSTHSQ